MVIERFVASTKKRQRERERKTERGWYFSTRAFIFGQLAAFRDVNILLAARPRVAQRRRATRGRKGRERKEEERETEMTGSRARTEDSQRKKEALSKERERERKKNRGAEGKDPSEDRSARDTLFGLSAAPRVSVSRESITFTHSAPVWPSSGSHPPADEGGGS